MIAILLLVALPLAAAVEVVLLPPVRAEGRDVGIIVVPGASIDGRAYQALGESIQQLSSLRVWVALTCNYTLTMPNFPEVGQAVGLALDAFQQQGMKSSDFFVAGHSLGGLMIQVDSSSYMSKMRGMMLFGAYLLASDDWTTFATPTLTLAGELDGLTRVTIIYQSFSSLRAASTSDMPLRAKLPVWVVLGVNHGQFASGPLPPFVLQRDLKAEVDEATAHARMAEGVHAFMAAQLGDTQEIQVLQQAYQNTSSFFAPFDKAYGLDRTPDGSRSPFAELTQYVIANMSAATFSVNDTSLSSTATLTFSHPSISGNNETGVHVQSVSLVSYPANPFDTSDSPLTASEISVKVKSQEALQQYFPAKNLTRTSCKDVNQLAFNTVFRNVVSVEAYMRFGRSGRPVLYHDDISVTGPEWLLHGLELDDKPDGLHVTSYSAVAPLDFPIPGVRGSYNCKVLAPSRALEWIYVDGLRPRK